MSFIAQYAPFLSLKGTQRKTNTSKRRSILTRSWRNMLAALLVLASIISGIATYAALKEIPPLGNDPNTVIWLLNVDLIILLMLIGLIARRVVVLWGGRKRGLAGSHLHVRLVYTFSLLAATPAIAMTVFSAFFFHYGVQSWFSERVSTAINESQAVAQAYLEEHTQVIRADTLAMASDIDRQVPFLVLNDLAFEQTIQTQSLLRNLSEAIVFNKKGRVLARSGLTFSLEFEDIPQYAMRDANDGEVVVITGGGGDRVRALTKLNNLIDTYLFVGRMIDPQVLAHVAATKEASDDYADLQTRYSGLQITVTMIFVVVGLVLMMLAIWLGLILARQLVAPITTLIATADRVRSGDFTARVEHQSGKIQEFDYLASAFDRMTEQIQGQQSELIEANRQLDRRRQFTETVLEGVSSGVIGVDENSIINLANSSAVELLHTDEDEAVGQSITALIPEVKVLLRKAHMRQGKVTQGQILVKREGQSQRTFFVRIAVEMIGEQDMGAVLTFDDITALEAAQRKAAWADVARRIAHEIKNPLTPIQLSAERLHRKYLSQISEDADTFSQCTDTIIKHVGDIGRMVDEFSSFARMPQPVMKDENLCAHVKDTIFLYKQAHSDISFELKSEIDKAHTIKLDAQLIRQALNNLIQNATDSIEARIADDGKNATPGEIEITLAKHGEREIALIIADNGGGLPAEENADSLSEPYVTHKQKGTGLGLAIVKKVMEDHEGTLHLVKPDWLGDVALYNDLDGATIVLTFPLDDAEAETEQG